MQRVYNLGDILDRQTACNDDGAKCIRTVNKVPVEDLAGAAHVGRARVQKKSSVTVCAQDVDAEVRIDAHGFDDLYPLDHGAVVRRFIAVKLNGMKAQRERKILEVRRVRMI